MATRTKGHGVSRTVPVGFGGRWFWAYDVSLAILLLEATLVHGELAPGQRPPRADAAVEDLRIQVRVGSNQFFALDSEGWDTEQRDHVRSIVATAGRRLRGCGVVTAAEAAQRYLIDGEPYFLRGHEQIAGEVVADLAEAIESLIQDQLPAVPSTDQHWFYGVAGGPRLR